MSILIAEDDLVSRRTLEATLQRWGHEVRVVGDGQAAWEVLSGPEPPALAILDWMMPGMDGLELCRRIRQEPSSRGTYVILLTARNERKDLVAGLDSGADDYMVKPFDREELRARVGVGLRVIALQHSLAQRIRELEEAVERVRQLQGLLPMCCYCKRIRDDHNYWRRVEEYLASHSGAQISHGICPQCFDTVVREQMAEHSLLGPDGVPGDAGRG
jgi:CheY-like chemotaxis protein